jgi:hypothetical protein
VNDYSDMSLALYFHPFASFCWKALIVLYENDTPFEPIIVDFRDEKSGAAFRVVWPIAKMPVLRRGEESNNRGVDHGEKAAIRQTRSCSQPVMGPQFSHWLAWIPVFLQCCQWLASRELILEQNPRQGFIS